jgi:integral membrane protein (TIGR01906 family)
VGNVWRSVASVAIAISSALVVVAVGILVFLNPIWVGFEQARTGADRFTGYSLDDVHRVTNAVLGELIFGPATFLQQVAGVGVFDERERQHLADVHGVMLEFFAVAVIAIGILVVAALRARDRAWLWRSVAAGTAVLGGAVIVVGVLFAVFFDAMFDIFHRVFFAAGSYDFDPLTERLVQLFPEDFWSETSTALAVVLLVVSLAVTWFAFRRIAAATTVAAAQDAPPAGATRAGTA